LFGKKSFVGGVHPHHCKSQTEKLPIEILYPPEKVKIPISMHIGAPAKTLVKRNDHVRIGQTIAEAGGFVSSPVHASISGKVTSIGPCPHPMGRNVPAIEITNDNKDDFFELESLSQDWREAAPGEIINKISSCGIVGMGGASFPTHVKLSPPSDKKIDTLIINGAECEPFLTADHRLLLEKTDEILTGMSILKKTLNAKNAIIGIEDNKPDAIEIVKKKLSDNIYRNLVLVKLKTKYPQGGEKQLINAITNREVPSGGLPMDVGCVVQNVGTAYAVWDAICNGIPLYQRVVTVTGPLVKKCANLLIRIGTPLRHVLDFCDADITQTKKLIMGGPMMGITQVSLDAPVIKSTSGLIAFDEIHPAIQSHNCISCGNCVKACPMHLVPSFIAKYVNKGFYETAEEWNILDCMECGSCAYVCPSMINLVHFMKLGKYNIMSARKAAGNKK
jgi:electron transport complex protein RnfC